MSRLTALAALLGLGACGAAFVPPENIAPVARGAGYQAQWRAPTRDDGLLRSATINAETCLPPAGGAVAKAPSGPRDLALSRGDLLELRLGGDETFEGRYVVARDGTLSVPYLSPVPAAGRTLADVREELATRMQAEGISSGRPVIALDLSDLAPVHVTVSGAVFNPQAVQVGGVSGTDRDLLRQASSGSSTEGRNLSAALRAAGGIRPDADISAVRVHRGSRVHAVDMRGVFEGSHLEDIILVTGDRIEVPSRRCFQDDLMRPSPISPPGITLYLSNLTQPALHNAASAIGRDVREVPWGTRYMQAVIDANCVGGPRVSSAGRSAVLYSRNPVTGVSAVIERDIEALVRRADRDDFDPYLLPGDALACYDSSVTNATELARVARVLRP